MCLCARCVCGGDGRGAVMYIVECLVASLVQTHEMQVSAPVVTIKNVLG